MPERSNVVSPIALAKRHGWNAELTRRFGRKPRGEEVETYFFLDYRAQIVPVLPPQLLTRPAIVALYGSVEAVLAAHPLQSNEKQFSVGYVGGRLTFEAEHRSLYGPTWDPRKHGFDLNNRGHWIRTSKSDARGQV